MSWCLLAFEIKMTTGHRKRAWTDPQMYTHLALVPGVWVALQRDPVMLELVVLQGIV